MLRWLGDGWSLEVGDATLGGTLRALGRTRFTGPDALRVLQQVIAFRLADGAAEHELERAEATIIDRGNPFLEPKRRERWGRVLIVDKLDEVELLALELAVHEALGDHQVAVRGRRLEARFKSEATLAAIIRREID